MNNISEKEMRHIVCAFAYSVHCGRDAEPANSEQFERAIQGFSEYFKGLENSDDSSYVEGEYGCFIGNLLTLQEELSEKDPRASASYWFEAFRVNLAERRAA